MTYISRDLQHSLLGTHERPKMMAPKSRLVTTEFLLGSLVRIWVRGHFNRSRDDSKAAASLKNLPNTGGNL